MYSMLYFRKGEGSLMEQILRTAPSGKNAYGKHGLCGGRGACGKCRVRFLTDAPLPSFADRKIFSPEELRLGWRLACTAKPPADCEVEICFEPEEENKTEIVTWSEVGTPVMQQSEAVAGEEPSSQEKRTLFCAVDIGTTTVVMELVDSITGDILSTCPFLNPQRAYGVDVMSRIANAENGGNLRLREVLLTEMEKGLRELEKAGKPEKIIVSGNTTMGHLLLGYPVEGLGKAPFKPFSLDFAHFDLIGHPVVFLPGISAFVGADIVSGIYACGMTEEIGETEKKEVSLFIDLGTNGEIAVGNQEKIWCTATAAGSAFEGDITAQAMGTDIVALAYDMLQTGIMDESGLLAESWFTDGCPIKTEKGDTVLIRQQDIRSLQMAKAAICAGVSILLDKAEAWERISHVYLAGGFGYYLDVEKAVGIGLIPKVLRDKCVAVGNTSLAGAVRYGKACADNEAEKLRHIVQISEAINLAQQPEFEQRYIEAMAFREM